ncbi:MAG TPA: phage baseplate protein [Roseovarius sp.]|nr:phage baseplate protein [Roseovarius sp.]
MSGLSRHTARPMALREHVFQSIADILTTPVGTRVMRCDYGSRLPRLRDAPGNPETVTEVFHESAIAIARWEPRFVLSRVQLKEAEDGHHRIELTGAIGDERVEFELDVEGAAA